MTSRPQPPRWLLGGLVILSGVYFEMNPAIRFAPSVRGAQLTGLEQVANLLLAATVATFLFIALRAIGQAMDRWR